MTDKQKKYEVRWSKTAALALSKLFNIDHETVFIRSLTLLSGDPKAEAYGVANFPKFRFNGHYWTLINNVVVVYTVSDERQIVRVRACYFSNTEKSHHIFWGIEPGDE